MEFKALAWTSYLCLEAELLITLSPQVPDTIYDSGADALLLLNDADEPPADYDVE